MDKGSSWKITEGEMLVRTQPITLLQIFSYYSLSDSSLTITFAAFLGQNGRVFQSNLANMLGALLRVCINIFFVSTPQNVDFAHKVPL